MEELVLKLNQPYVVKMQKLLKVIGKDDLFVDKFCEYHVNRLNREIVRMQLSLEKYELKYKMKSADFHQRIETGELEDDRYFVMWSGIYELLLDSKKQLRQLS